VLRLIYHSRMVAPATTTTILFTDLVGSTELMQQAGDERAQRIFQAHYRLLQDAVAAKRRITALGKAIPATHKVSSTPRPNVRGCNSGTRSLLRPMREMAMTGWQARAEEMLASI
jgi:hypothetical protein